MTTVKGELHFQRGDLMLIKNRKNGVQPYYARVCMFQAPSDSDKKEFRTSNARIPKVICYPEPVLTVQSNDSISESRRFDLNKDLALGNLTVKYSTDNPRLLTAVEKAYAGIHLKAVELSLIAHLTPSEVMARFSADPDVANHRVWPDRIEVIKMQTDAEREHHPVKSLYPDGLIVRGSCDHEFEGTFVEAVGVNGELVGHERVTQSIFDIIRGDDKIRDSHGAYIETACEVDSMDVAAASTEEDGDSTMNECLSNRSSKRRSRQTGAVSSASKRSRQLLPSFQMIERKLRSNKPTVISTPCTPNEAPSQFIPLWFEPGVFQIEYRLKSTKIAEGDRDHVKPVTISLVITPTSPNHCELTYLPTEICLGSPWTSAIPASIQDGCVAKHPIKPSTMRGSPNPFVPVRCEIMCLTAGLEVKHDGLMPCETTDTYFISGFQIVPTTPTFRLSDPNGQDIECHARFFVPEKDEPVAHQSFTIKLMAGQVVKLVRDNLPDNIQLRNGDPFTFALSFRDQFDNLAPAPVAQSAASSRKKHAVEYPRVTVSSTSAELHDAWAEGKIADFPMGEINQDAFDLPMVTLPNAAFMGRTSVDVTLQICVKYSSTHHETFPVSLSIKPSHPPGSPRKLVVDGFPSAMSSCEALSDDVRVYCVDQHGIPVILSDTDAACYSLKLELESHEGNPERTFSYVLTCSPQMTLGAISHWSVASNMPQLPVGRYSARVVDSNQNLRSDRIECVDITPGKPHTMKLVVELPGMEPLELSSDGNIPDLVLVEHLFVRVFDQAGNLVKSLPKGASISLSFEVSKNVVATTEVYDSKRKKVVKVSSVSINSNGQVKPFLFRSQAEEVVSLVARFSSIHDHPSLPHVQDVTISLKVVPLPGRVRRLRKLVASTQPRDTSGPGCELVDSQALDGKIRNGDLVAGCVLDSFTFVVDWNDKLCHSPFLHATERQATRPDRFDLMLASPTAGGESEHIVCVFECIEQRLASCVMKAKLAEVKTLEQAGTWVASVIWIESFPDRFASLSATNAQDVSLPLQVLPGLPVQLALLSDTLNPTVSNLTLEARCISPAVSISLRDQFNNNLSRTMLSVSAKQMLDAIRPVVVAVTTGLERPAIDIGTVSASHEWATVTFKDVRVQASSDTSPSSGSFLLQFCLGANDLNASLLFTFTDKLKEFNDAQRKQQENKQTQERLKTECQAKANHLANIKANKGKLEADLKTSKAPRDALVKDTKGFIISFEKLTNAKLSSAQNEQWDVIYRDYDRLGVPPTVQYLTQMDTLQAHLRHVLHQTSVEQDRCSKKAHQHQAFHFGSGYLGTLGQCISVDDVRIAHALTCLRSNVLSLHVVVDAECPAYAEIKRRKAGRILILKGQNPYILPQELPHIKAASRQQPNASCNPRYVRNLLQVVNVTAATAHDKHLIELSLSNQISNLMVVNTPKGLDDYVNLVDEAREQAKARRNMSAASVRIPSIITLSEEIMERSSSGVEDHSREAYRDYDGKSHLAMNVHPSAHCQELIMKVEAALETCAALKIAAQSVTDMTPIDTKLKDIILQLNVATTALQQAQQAEMSFKQQLTPSLQSVQPSSQRSIVNASDRSSRSIPRRNVRFSDSDVLMTGSFR